MHNHPYDPNLHCFVAAGVILPRQHRSLQKYEVPVSIPHSILGAQNIRIPNHNHRRQHNASRIEIDIDIDIPCGRRSPLDLHLHWHAEQLIVGIRSKASPFAE